MLSITLGLSALATYVWRSDRRRVAVATSGAARRAASERTSSRARRRVCGSTSSHEVTPRRRPTGVSVPRLAHLRATSSGVDRVNSCPAVRGSSPSSRAALSTRERVALPRAVAVAAWSPSAATWAARLSAARPRSAASAGSSTAAWSRRSSPAMAGASRSTTRATSAWAAFRMPAASLRGAATESVTITKSPGVFRTMASWTRRKVGADSASAPTGTSGSSPRARETARATSSALRPSVARTASRAAPVASSPRAMDSFRTTCSATRLTRRASACGVFDTAAATSARTLMGRTSTESANRRRFWVGDRTGAYFPRKVPRRVDARAAVPGPDGMGRDARVPAHHAASSSPYTRAYSSRRAGTLRNSSPRPRPTVTFLASLRSVSGAPEASRLSSGSVALGAVRSGPSSGVGSVRTVAAPGRAAIEAGKASTTLSATSPYGRPVTACIPEAMYRGTVVMARNTSLVDAVSGRPRPRRTSATLNPKSSGSMGSPVVGSASYPSRPKYTSPATASSAPRPPRRTAPRSVSTTAPVPAGRLSTPDTAASGSSNSGTGWPAARASAMACRWRASSSPRLRAWSSVKTGCWARASTASSAAVGGRKSPVSGSRYWRSTRTGSASGA